MFAEPPTDASLVDARRVLEETQASVAVVDAELAAAEAALARVVRESRAHIDGLEKRRSALAQREAHTLGYLSPMRRLPLELLRNIFNECFEAHPCCAWVLAAVCGAWRRLALRMPTIWSRIRLVTTQHASADTIRLWLERSGDSVPLDIEIFLRVTGPGSRSRSSSSRHGHSPPVSRSPSPPPWHVDGGAAHFFIPPVPTGVWSPAPIVVPHSPTLHAGRARHSRASLHWGHIALFYLVEQMHRWERFIFRFDRQFASMSALKSITGSAPLLREFEVSSAEAVYFPEWQWLPNAPASAALVLPRLKTLTLQYAPFRWSSPIFRTDLHSLTLRALPTTHLPLDRILAILAANPALHALTLHFHAALPPVLPLAPTPLPALHSLHIGGHHSLTQLIDALALPRLATLALDIDPRDHLDTTILPLLLRSASPALTHLSISYTATGAAGTGAGAAGAGAVAAGWFYGPAPISSWPALLAALPALHTLRVGGTALEPLLAALTDAPAAPGSPAACVCPALEALAVRQCHVHGDGVVKLVALVEARNPAMQGVGDQEHAVKRLRSLELYECTSVGEDVVRWLAGRVEEVVCTEPEFVRCVWGV